MGVVLSCVVTEWMGDGFKKKKINKNLKKVQLVFESHKKLWLSTVEVESKYHR